MAATATANRRSKLNKIDWEYQKLVTVFGVQLHLRAQDEGELEKCLKMLPPGWRESRSRGVDRTYSILGQGEDLRIYAERRRLRLPNDEYTLLDMLENDAQMFVAEHAPRLVFIHAGVVAWKGKAILIPGLSFSGKSTLTVALAKAGATYYSDEYAVLDEQGRVHPYPRPISIRREGKFKGEPHSPEELGFKVGKRPLPVGLILVTRYKKNAVWKAEPISGGQGALALFANAVAARRAPEQIFPVLRQVCDGTTILKGFRGDINDDVVKKVLT